MTSLTESVYCLAESHAISSSTYFTAIRSYLGQLGTEGVKIAESISTPVSIDDVVPILNSLKETNLFAARAFCEFLLDGKYFKLTELQESIIIYEVCDIIFSLGPFCEAATKAEASIKIPVDKDTLCKFHLLLGNICRSIGKVDVATVHYQKVEELASKLDSCSSQIYNPLAFIYQQICVYARGSNDEPIKKLTPLTENTSLEVVPKIVLHQALGNIYRSAADFHNAKSHFEEAIRIAESSGNMFRALECIAELGRNYRSSGCYHMALIHQKKLLDFALDRGDILNIANACGYIGFTYYSMGERYYNEAIKYLYCKLELSRDELKDSSGYRWSLNNLGKVHLELKEYDICRNFFIESSEIAKQHDNTLGLGTAYGNLGTTCRATGKYDEAIKYHKLYLEISQKNFDTGGMAIMQRELTLDNLYLFKNETNIEKQNTHLIEAEKCACQGMKLCLDMRSWLKKEDDLLKIGNFERNQAKLHSLLLFVLVQQRQYEAALVISELGRAHALADRIKNKFNTDHAFLTNLISVIGNDDRIDYSALATMLGNVGELVADHISHLLVYSVVEIPTASEGKRERMLYMWHVKKSTTNESSDIVIKFAQTPMSKWISENETQFSTVDENYLSELMREIHFGNEANMIAKPKTKPETKPDLEKNSVIPSNGTEVTRDIIRRKNPTLQNVESRPQPKRDKLELLYDLLILPLHEYIYSPSDHLGRLIIIPHGFLFGVPFCALKTQGTYLVEKFVLSISPSLYILDISRKREDEWSKMPTRNDDVTVFAVGNPKMPLDIIQQLPGAEKEVNEIASICQHVNLLTGESATKNEVLKGFTKYPVIHLATHAIEEASLSDHLEAVSKEDKYAVGDYAVKGAIVLARSDSLCSGVITSSDLEKLNLTPSCELVVLSCCNTARGKITGDGILGLSRSLMCAGIMNMIVTLWPIHDSSTPKLMNQFYKHYINSRDAPAALHASMVYLIQENYKVERWAAFSCIGRRSLN